MNTVRITIDNRLTIIKSDKSIFSSTLIPGAIFAFHSHKAKMEWENGARIVWVNEGCGQEVDFGKDWTLKSGKVGTSRKE